MIININILIAEPECADTTVALVDGNPPIIDANIIATSAYSSSWAAINARMSSGNAWAASNLDKSAAIPNFYIQVCTIDIYEFSLSFLSQ